MISNLTVKWLKNAKEWEEIGDEYMTPAISTNKLLTRRNSKDLSYTSVFENELDKLRNEVMSKGLSWSARVKMKWFDCW